MQYALAGLCLVSAALAFAAQPASGVPASTGKRAEPASKTAKSEDAPRWSELSPAHRMALKPLERDWPLLDAPRKQKWLDIAARMPGMSVDERQRVQMRMAQWAAMTPVQRTQARLQFLEVEDVSRSDRQARWEAYQALSPDQKRQLAGQRAQAAEVKPAASRSDTGAGQQPQQKTNLVPNPSAAARPKAVAPAVVQAAPGATTSLVSKPATPPAHQQVGLPKIAGSANFIDPATLLPRRGPQGAAVTAAGASAPLPRP